MTGREPSRLAIVPAKAVTLSGLVTGFPGGARTNRPLAGAHVEVFAVSPETGERQGDPLHSKQTGGDGAWGRSRPRPTLIWNL